MPFTFLRAGAARLRAFCRKACLEPNGLQVAWSKARVLPEIVRWRAPAEWPLEQTVEVHVLTCQRDWLCAAWALASFVHFTRRRWMIVVHDDGTLDTAARERLAILFPTLKVIARPEADEALTAQFAAHPRCREYREAHPLALKLFDCALLARTERLILLDSDLLFFQPPREVLEWVDEGGKACLFNPDFQDAYCLSRADAAARLGVDLWRCVNTGLSLLPREVIDLDFCETCLADESMRDPESIAWREQTLLALGASRLGEGGLLPERYEVTFNLRIGRDSISRHYVGELRRWFYTEGLGRLRRILFS